MDVDNASQSSKSSTVSPTKKPKSHSLSPSTTNAGGRSKNDDKKSTRRKKGPEPEVPQKVVIRHLPPTITEDDFLKAVAPLPPYDYFYFKRADMSLGAFAFSRAYIHFRLFDDLLQFRDRFDSYVFVDAKGNEFVAAVEFAPFQRMPKVEKRRDKFNSTIENDPDYISFCTGLEEPVKIETSTFAEAYLEELEAREKELKANHACPKVVTPLMEYVEKKLRGSASSDRRDDYKKRRERDRGRKDDKRGEKKSVPKKGGETDIKADRDRKLEAKKKARNDRRKKKDRLKSTNVSESEKKENVKPVKVLQKEKLPIPEDLAIVAVSVSKPIVDESKKKVTEKSEQTKTFDKSDKSKTAESKQVDKGKSSKNYRSKEFKEKSDKEREGRDEKDTKSKYYERRGHRHERSNQESKTSSKLNHKEDKVTSSKRDERWKSNKNEVSSHSEPQQSKPTNNKASETSTKPLESTIPVSLKFVEQREKREEGEKSHRTERRSERKERVPNKYRPALEIYRPGARRQPSRDSNEMDKMGDEKPQKSNEELKTKPSEEKEVKEGIKIERSHTSTPHNDVNHNDRRSPRFAPRIFKSSVRSRQPN